MRKTIIIVTAAIILCVAGSISIIHIHYQPVREVAMKSTLASDKVDSLLKNSLHTVLITHSGLSPADITVSEGTDITWVNTDSFEHTVLLNENAGVFQVEPHTSLTKAFHAGTITYTCSGLHDTGKITILPGRQ